MLMLAPGHYEFETAPYAYMRVDFKAGDMKVAPIYAPSLNERPVLDLPVPPACN